MNRFLQTFTVVVGILVSTAITAQAASKVNVSELAHSSTTGVNRSSFKPKKTSHECSEMQAMSSKLRLKSNSCAKVTSRVSMRSVADQEIPVIYGNVIDSYELFDFGLYQLPRSEDEGFEPVIMDIEGERGGVALNGTYYVTTDDYDGGTVRGYSLNSGEVVYEAEVPYEQVPITLCLNPADNKLYGIFNPEEYTGAYVFANIDYSTDTPELTQIGTLPEGVYTALSCDALGNMYVLRDVVNEYYEIYDSEFLKVDVTTGDLTLIGNVGYFSEYDTSGCIDPATGRMFYAMCTFEACSLIEIDVKTGHGTELLDFPNMEEVVGMYCPSAEISGTAPAMAEDLHLSFENGNLSGKVTFTAPSTLYDGSAATSNMEYHVICNEEEKTGSLIPGATADVEFSFSEAGRYVFRVYFSNESGDGPAALAETFVGEDIPALPSAFYANYSDGKMTLKWDVPEVGEDGGYIDVAKISYCLVQLSPEEKLLEESIKGNMAEVSMEAPEEKTTFIYALTLNYGEQEIGTVNSNAVVLGSLLPPYSQDFSDSESMNDFTVLDVNGDDETWTYFGNCVRIRSNSQLASDDWLILPGIKMTEGKTYGISWRSWCASRGYPEKMEVMVGLEPTAQAMDTSVLEPTVISNLQEDALIMESKFSPSATGIYYIGFHAISDADSYFLYLTDISVVQSADSSAPSAPIDFKVMPDALGNPSAEISLIVPSEFVNGEAMDAPDEIKVMCDGKEIKLYENPAAGTVLTFTHILGTCGDYTFTAIAIKDGMESDLVSQTVYCGPGMPGAVKGVTLSEIGDTGEVILKWNAVVENSLGNAINPELVKYNVFRIENNAVAEIIETNFSGTEISLSPEFEESQDFVRYAVYGVTDKGQGVGMESDMIPIGEPYKNFAESFTDGELKYIFGVNVINEGSLGVYNDNYVDGVTSCDGDNGFMLFYGQQTGQGVELSSGKISIADMADPVLELYLRNFGEDDINEFEVEIRVPGGDYVTKLSTTPPTVGSEEWNLISIPLSELNSDNMQFRLRGVINNYGSIGVDNIKVYDAKTTLIETLDSQLHITTCRGTIRIEGGEDVEAMLHSASGITRKLLLNGDVTLAVDAGVYILSTDSHTIKIMVP